LRQLKEQGVTEKELLAIVATRPAPVSSARQSAAAPAIAGPVGEWQIHETKDALTGDVHSTFVLPAKNDAGGQVDVNATCSVDDTFSSINKALPFLKPTQFPARHVFQFRVQYHSPQPGKGFRFETVEMSPATIRETLGGSYEINKPVNVSYVQARLKL